MSPIAPFYGDWLYRNMLGSASGNSASVHLTDFAKVNPQWQDADLETSMDLAQRICSLVHSIRKGHKIKVRQPLSKILIPILSETTREQIRHMEELIKTEVNIKAIEYLDDASGVLSKKVKPNFKALGPKFGKDMKAVANGIAEMSAEDLSNLEQNKTFNIQHSAFTITLYDVEILTEDLPGYLTASDSVITVALDTHITSELKQEGIAREFVNRVQNFRKDSGFEVTDKIAIQLQDTNVEVSASILAFKDYISQEVQALSFSCG